LSQRPTDYGPALAFLKQAGPFLLSTHHNADGDGIGALLALSGMLRQMDRPHRIVVSDDGPDKKFAFLPGFDRIESFARLTDLPSFPFAVVVDTPTASEQRVGPAARLITSTTRAMVIDHHEGTDSGAAVVVTDTGASAACEMIYHLARAAGTTITKDMAGAIYTGIVFDTKLFKYSHPERALRACADLAALGADPVAIADALFAHQSFATVKTLGASLSSLRLHLDGRVATLHVDHATYQLGGDLDPIVDHAMSIDGVEVALFLKEQSPGSHRVSLRSRGRVDVNEIARPLGGGGHRNASGCTLTGDLAAVRKTLLSAVESALKGL
jgi:phosphoesterase RecJ-like protein